MKQKRRPPAFSRARKSAGSVTTAPDRMITSQRASEGFRASWPSPVCSCRPVRPARARLAAAKAASAGSISQELMWRLQCAASAVP